MGKGGREGGIEGGGMNIRGGVGARISSSHGSTDTGDSGGARKNLAASSWRLRRRAFVNSCLSERDVRAHFFKVKPVLSNYSWVSCQNIGNEGVLSFNYSSI